MDPEPDRRRQRGNRKRYSFAIEEPTARKDTTSVIVRTIVCLHRPLLKFQQCLEKIGFFITRNPKITIVAPVLILVLGCLGFLRMNEVHVSNDSFKPSNSKERNEELRNMFFTSSNFRKEEIIFLPKKGKNILTQKCLEEAFAVHDAVTNITGYQVVCARRKPNASYPCMMINLLEILRFNRQMIQNISTLLSREWKGRAQLLSNGRTLPYEVNNILSGFKMILIDKNSQEFRFTAAAMKIIYILKEQEAGDYQILRNQWEKTFISTLNSMMNHLTCTDIFYISEADKSNTISKLFTPDFLALRFSAFALLAFTLLLILVSRTTRGSLIVFGFGVSCSVLSIVSSVAIGFACGASFSYATIVILVFLFGKGLFESLMLTYELENLSSIVGISCKFPQAENKEKFWEMLSNGNCAVTEFPSNRPEEFETEKTDLYYGWRLS